MNTTPSKSKGCTVRLYLRKSLGNDVQAESFNNQRASHRALLERNGWAKFPAVEYTDSDRSGSDFTREGLAKLVEETRAGDLVVAYKQDRIGRNMFGTAEVLDVLINQRKARVFYSSTGAEVNFKSAVQQFMVVAEGFGGQQERESLCERTKDALVARARDGYQTGRLVYGYTGLPDESTRRTLKDGRVSVKKRIVVDEDTTAPIVRRIFTRYAAGDGAKRIALALNADHIPSPSGGAWFGDGVTKVLTREQYAGIILHARTTTTRKGGKKTQRPAEAPPLRVERPDLRVVEPAVYEAVRERLATQRSEQGPGDRATKNALAGILRCGTCGGNMVAHSSPKAPGGKPRRRYVCWNRLGRGEAGCSAATRYHAELLEGAIFDFVREEILPELLESIRVSVRAKLAVRLAPRMDGAALVAELARLKASKAKAIKLAIACDGDADVAAEVKRLNGEIVELEKQAAVAAAPPDALALRKLENAAMEQVESLRPLLVAAGGAVARDALRSVTGPLTVAPVADGYLVTGEAQGGVFGSGGERPGGWKHPPLPIRLLVKRAA